MPNTTRVSDLFATADNKEYLLKSLKFVFGARPEQLKIIEDNFSSFFSSSLKKTQHEERQSDPLPWVTPTMQLDIYNKQFIKDVSAFVISLNIPSAVSFSLSERQSGEPATPIGYKEAPDDLLASWQRRAGGKLRPKRDDPSRDFGYNGDADSGDEPAPTMDFCDQDDDNVDQHLNWLNTGYRAKFNKDPTTPFGVSTPESDARLLSRRIFRSEGGVENAIPRRRIFHRNLDRDIKETMNGIERETPIRGYDMSELRRLTDAKNAYSRPGGPLAADYSFDIGFGSGSGLF